MKKILTIFICLCLLAGCSNDLKSSVAPNITEASVATAMTTATVEPSSASVETESPSAAAPSSASSDSGNIGNYAVSILNCEQIKDYNGKPALVVYFNFTNNDTDQVSFLLAVTVKAFQNNIELSDAIITSFKGDELTNSMKDVKTGGTVKVAEAYSLSDNSPVEIDVNDLFGTGTPLVKTLTLTAAQPSASAEPSSSPAKTETPSAAPSAASSDSGNIGNYAVSILNCEKTKDYNGKPALVVYFNFTNNDPAQVSFLLAVSVKAFQNNVELSDAIITSFKGDEITNSMKDVKTGGTIKVAEAYSLSDNSPVEIDVNDLFGTGTPLVKTFTLN